MPLSTVRPRRRQLSLVAPEVGELAKSFVLLSDDTRLKIFALLTKGELWAFLAFRFSVPLASRCLRRRRRLKANAD